MRAIAELVRLDPTEAAEKVLDAHRERTEWLDEFAEALDRRRSGRTLRRILAVWGVNQMEAAELFGVTRQAVSKWLDRGIPAERAEAIAELAAGTDLLVRYVKRDRIPAVVRRPASALGGRSLLDLVRASRPHDVLDACRSMFDFERART